MYNINIKITKKNTEKNKEVISLLSEGFKTYEEVRKHGVEFLNANAVPKVALVHYNEVTNIGDISIESPLSFRYYNKKIEGYFLKIDVKITLSI